MVDDIVCSCVKAQEVPRNCAKVAIWREHKRNVDVVGTAGYGGHGFGGGGWILGAVVILFLLFKDGFMGRGHERGEGHGGGRTWFPDESNWELEAHQGKQFSRTRDVIRKEGEETRHLITNNTIQDLRDKVTDKNMVIQRLENEGFTTALFSKLMGEIADIKCNMLKRPPTWGTAVAPNAHLIEPGGARRGRFDDFDFA